jgi:acyl carrier protein phosphodiesterase
LNYLAHAYLSFNRPEVLAGNMMGDFVKGKHAVEDFPEGIQTGLMLHRKIDSFTDAHPAVHRAKNYFRVDYGLYSGVFVDVINDHFLANDPRYFSSEEALMLFTQELYKATNHFQSYFPEGFGQMFSYMSTENWLYQYRTLKGIRRSFSGLQKRAAHITQTDRAFEIFASDYYALNQCYYELIDDLVNFVKIELSI